MAKIHTVIYGKGLAKVTRAAGVSGVLCKRATDGRCFFRVYSEDHTFIDYDLRHDELAVTISKDELASCYRVGTRNILDHGPGVLGLKGGSTGEARCGSTKCAR